MEQEILPLAQTLDDKVSKLLYKMKHTDPNFDFIVWLSGRTQELRYHAGDPELQ